MPPTLPPLSSLPELPQEQQFQVLDTLFESSPELHALMAPVLANQTFSSYTSLIETVGGRMSALSAANSNSNPASVANADADRAILLGILGSHPRLGQPKAAASAPAAEHLSELSKKEQADLNAGGATQAENLRVLNAEYEEKFPGLRFVTFVNGRGRDVIMQEMRLRIDRGDGEREVEEIIQAMCDIAKDRARKLEQQSSTI